MIQGTQEWLEWRRGGIGASEAAAIMGVCPYSTQYKVWMEKTGRAKAFEGNFATQRGSELEAKIRSRYELISMEDMPPATATHPKYDFLRASLDGLRADNKLILELKAPGAESHALAKSGKVPEHYMVQVQQQLLVTGADLCHYFSFSDKDQSHALVEVEPDLKMQAKLIIELEKFWNLVKGDTPPPLTNRDFKDVSLNMNIVELIKRLVADHKSMKKNEVDLMKAKIIEMAEHPKVEFGTTKISTVLRDGKFSYYKLTV